MDGTTKTCPTEKELLSDWNESFLWWKDLSFKPQSSREMNLSLPSAQILHVPKLIDKWLAKKPLKLLLSRHLFWLQVVYSDIFVRKLSTRRFSRFHPHFKPASSVNWRNFMNQTNPPTKKNPWNIHPQENLIQQKKKTFQGCTTPLNPGCQWQSKV